MQVRYGIAPNGKLVKKAVIYTKADHSIAAATIDADAGRAVLRLKRAGFTAFIVGGAIRDLLTGRTPKDFDISTDARPRQIRKVFANSRIIGKRFRLVHLYYGPAKKQKIIEVSTFRSGGQPDMANHYGTLEEDVWRRDFTMNALFYCPQREIIVDYAGGFQDIKERRIKTLIAVQKSFREDPVRIIRGVRYAGLTGFPLSPAIARAIQRQRHELAHCAAARITEEFYKILECGRSAAVFPLAIKLKLLQVLLPALDRQLRSGRKREHQEAFLSHLRRLDEHLLSPVEEKMDRGELLSYLFREPFRPTYPDVAAADRILLTQQFLRTAVHPLQPSKREIIKAVSILLPKRGRENKNTGRRRRPGGRENKKAGRKGRAGGRENTSTGRRRRGGVRENRKASPQPGSGIRENSSAGRQGSARVKENKPSGR